MALPTIAVLAADVEDLFAAFSDDKTKWGMQSAVNDLNALVGNMNRLYRPTSELTVTNLADATITAFFAAGGEGEGIRPKEVFRTLGTGDTTNTAFATAKGSALAANDCWIRTSPTVVTFLGTLAPGANAFDFAGETVTDFIDL